MPWKVIFRYIILIILFGYGVFWIAETHKVMRPTEKRAYKDFSQGGKIPENYLNLIPFVYSVDVFVPFVNLHQERYWLPIKTKFCGGICWLYMRLHIALGWIFSSLAVAGLTGLVPEDWAATQNNLANAYAERIRGERAENLEQAIGHYQQALKVRTLDAFPEDWADTQNNLAGAYAKHIRRKRAENLEQAIVHYQQALKVFTREALPVKHRQTKRSLGNLHFEHHNCPHALTAYQNAIAAGDDLLASAYSAAGRQAEVGETAQLFANASYCMLQSHQYCEAFVMLERGKTRLLRAYQTYYNTRHLKNWQEAIDSLTKRLWQGLIEPVHQRLSALNVKRVLLLPSGGLQLLPLHAAWYRDENGEKRSLLDNYEITYAPSAYALDIAIRRATKRRATERKDHKALVVGINDYKNLSQLFNAVPEAEAITRVLGVNPLLNAAATTSAAKSGAAGVAYLHLSCHGSFNWGNPMDSALYFAQDEPLRLSEIISGLDLSSALLVTLSACETGISDVRKSPDEYLGLPAGFLQAGAPAIISSLWTVDDRSTALLMERFYRNHIERGLTGPAALRDAQLWLRKATRKELGDYYKALIRMTAQSALDASMDISMSGAPDDRPYADPFYWAAFTYNGSSI